jgi:transposase
MGKTGTKERIVSIDTGKTKSYVVVEENGETVKEGYVETSKEGFGKMLANGENTTMIMETSSCFNGILSMIEGYGKVIAAYPFKVRLIAESVKKTDKVDAHTLLELHKAGFLPQSYVPSKRIRDLRELCHDRASLVAEATRLKNRLRYKMFSHGFHVDTFSRLNMEILKANEFTAVMALGLENVLAGIKELDLQIIEEEKDFRYAELIDSIPGIGSYSALAIASEIADISRFSSVEKLEAYAGLVPRVYQSGGIDRKGHIVKGNKYLKTLLVECVRIHIMHRKYSWITKNYERIAKNSGSKKKAVIAASRKLLRVIYIMLMEDREYHE